MIVAVDEHHVDITEQLRSRQASEPTSDDHDLFVKHERELVIGYVPERKVSTFGEAIRRAMTRSPVACPSILESETSRSTICQKLSSRSSSRTISREIGSWRSSPSIRFRKRGFR